MMLWVGCEAGDLGVAVPKGGTDVLHRSVLKRDLWKMTDPRVGGRAPGSSGAKRVAKYIAKRLNMTGLKPAFGNSFRRDLGANVGELVCGVRRGSGEQAVVVAALDPGIGTVSAIPIAGLLSLASTFETPTAPMHSLYFCVIPEAGGLNGFARRGPVSYQRVLESFILGTLTGSELGVDAGPVIGPVRTQLLHAGPLPVGMSDDIGVLDYATILSRLGDVYSVISTVD